MVPLLLMGLLVSCEPGRNTTAGKTGWGNLPEVTVGNAGRRVSAFCLERAGQRVGDGECWTLANEAFKSAGAHRPGSDMRVWGRRVDRATEKLLPGDVIEFRNAWFADGSVTGSAHTAVVVRGGPQENISIAEQNWGRKTVRIRQVNLAALRRGWIAVYRPS